MNGVKREGTYRRTNEIFMDGGDYVPYDVGMGMGER